MVVLHLIEMAGTAGGRDQIAFQTNLPALNAAVEAANTRFIGQSLFKKSPVMRRPVECRMRDQAGTPLTPRLWA
jgi:hypothetical protein